jgi:hypothetical protein
MPDIKSTDSRYIKYVDCNPDKQKKLVFEGSSLKVIQGSQVLDAVDFSGFFHPASENGGSFVKRFYLSPNAIYTLYGGNIAQDQGEVSMVIIRVNYSKKLTDQDKLITLEYNGTIFPCKNIHFVTGKTLDHIKHHGWDLEPWTDSQSSPEFSPIISPMPTEPDFGFGGILISNPTSEEVEIQILVMN